MTDFTIPTSVRELQVGDVIRLSGGNWSDGDRDGLETTVTRLELDSGEHYDRALVETPRANHVNDSDWPFVFVSRPDAEPELTFDEALAEGKYHPDLFPIFEKWSQEAQDAGYCPEYDRLVRSIGAPTRAEVRRIVAERDGAKFRVLIPVTVNIPVEITASSEEDARRQAENSPLNDAGDTSHSWPGLAAGVIKVAQDVIAQGYPRHETMTYQGMESYQINAL